MVIVDVNIVFPLFARGAMTDAAIDLLERDSTWCTEPFAMVELSNILTTYERSNLLTAGNAMEIMDRALGLLGPHFVSVTHQEALEVAMRYKITAYDARYIALAEKLRLPLITEDTRLRKAVPEATISLRDALDARD